MKQNQKAKPVVTYSRLNAEINYAYNPKQGSTTGSSPKAPYITPSVMEKIIKDARELGVK